jgi:hypothetical protein
MCSQAIMDAINISSLLAGILGVIVGVAGIVYGRRAKREADRASKGAMLGADEAPAIMPTRANGGFDFRLMNDSEFPQFDVWVRVYDYSQDTIIDPTRIFEGPDNHPRFPIGNIYPKHALGESFFRIDLRQRARARVNFFIHTRNAQSTVEVVALHADGGPRIAFRQRFSAANINVAIPEDFPIVDRGNPESLFDEDEPTGALLMRTPEGLRPA